MTALQQDAEKFAEFILKYYPAALEWKNPVTYCKWYISHGFVAVVCNDEDEIMAIGAARPVDRPGMGVLPAYFNPNGTCLHIDLLIDISPDQRAMLVFRDMCKARFPQCRTVALFRHFEEKLHIYPINRFWKSLEKIRRITKKDQSYGKRTKIS